MAETPKPAYVEKLHERDMSWEEFMAPPAPEPRPEGPPLDRVPYSDQVSLRLADRTRRRRA